MTKQNFIDNNFDDDMFLVIHPSQFCNIRCKFCYQNDFSNKIFLDHEVLFEKLIPIYKKTKYMILLGGEPTLIPEMKEYVKFITEKFPEINLEMVTNGILLDDDWIDLLLNGGVKTTISLNSSRSDIFANNLDNGGGEKIWETVFTNVVKFAKRRLMMKNNLPKLKLSMVVNEISAGDIDSFVLLSLALDSEIKLLFDCRGIEAQNHPAIHNAYNVANYYRQILEGTNLLSVVNCPLENLTLKHDKKLSNEQRIKEKQSLLQKATSLELPLGLSLDKNSKSFINQSNLNDHSISFPEFIDMPWGAENRILSGSKVCIAPWREILVHYDGEVYCCSRNFYSLGNINKQSIHEILDGSKLKEIKTKMINGDFAHCDPNCPANCNPKNNDNSLFNSVTTMDNSIYLSK